MPVYAKPVKTTSPRFQGRATTIASANVPGGTIGVSRIPVPNDVVLCNGCNSNIHETEEQQGYLVYLGKVELEQDRPYDIYCSDCLRKYFPKAQIVK